MDEIFISTLQLMYYLYLPFNGCTIYIYPSIDVESITLLEEQYGINIRIPR